MTDKFEVVTYAGQRTSDTGSLGFLYISSSGQEMFFSRKMHTIGEVGSTHRLHPGEKEDSWKKAGLEDYLGQNDNESRVTTWWIDHRAAITARDQKAQAKKDSYDRLVKTLEPVTKSYQRTTAPGRRAILASVIEIITSGRRIA
jgi:hypothetical protein